MKISIIGLGWLGEPLAHYLSQQGHQVAGSTTRPDKSLRLEKEGIPNTVLQFNPHPEGKGFSQLFGAELLIINIPPARRKYPDSFHPEQIKYIKSLLQQQGKTKKVIYTSATSVYPNVNRIVDENEKLDLDNSPNPALLNAENLLWNEKNYDLTVIRFGGLLGMDRIPGRYFAKKENVAGHPPANYIHQTDAARLIGYIIQKGLWNETFNGVCPIHPPKKEIYEKNAKELGLALPASYALENSANWKEVSSQKIINQGFTFTYPDPLHFKYPH